MRFQIDGRTCEFAGYSYQCKSLALYGYSTDLALARAIRRKETQLRKEGKLPPAPTHAELALAERERRAFIAGVRGES